MEKKSSRHKMVQYKRIQKQDLGEGEIFLKWLHSRLIRRNKNVLSAELGGTGSGKSYRDLRKMELWYDYYFKKKVPVENICFGLGQAMERLSSGELKKGDILIVEEAGVNLGSRNWQSKVSKMFNYVLQSFRSMNVGIFFNLPYLSMLDSQARHLLHYYGESLGVDEKTGQNKCKPFFVEVAQSSGKIYRHYPKVKIGKRGVKVRRFIYNMPSQYLVDAYEKKKEEYLKDLIKDFSDKTNGKKEEKKKEKIPRNQVRPPPIAFQCYDMYQNSKLTQEEVGEKLGLSQQGVSHYIRMFKKWIKAGQNSQNMEDVTITLPQTIHQQPINIKYVSHE